jgi:hypothetical protein
MNKIILSIATAALLFLGVEQSTAQVKLPPSSSSQTITQGLGIKDIVLSYQRPNKNNRVIFGGLVPFIGLLLTTTYTADPLVGLWYPIGIAALSLFIGTVYLNNRIDKDVTD